MKKSAIILIDSKEITFEHILFSERIIVAGEEKSSKTSFIGSKHRFKINEDNFVLHSRYNLFDKSIIQVEVLKNSELLKTQILKMTFIERLPWIVLGIISGIVCYQLF